MDIVMLTVSIIYYSFYLAHFDAKGEIEEYIQRSLPSTIEWTIIRMSFYFNNFLTTNKPTVGSDGKRHVAIPMGNYPLPGIDVRDVGRCIVSEYICHPHYLTKSFCVEDSSGCKVSVAAFLCDLQCTHAQ